MKDKVVTGRKLTLVALALVAISLLPVSYTHLTLPTSDLV